MSYTCTFKDGKVVNIPDKESAIALFRAGVLVMVVIHHEVEYSTGISLQSFKSKEDEALYEKAWQRYLNTKTAEEKAKDIISKKLQHFRKVVRAKKSWVSLGLKFKKKKAKRNKKP